MDPFRDPPADTLAAARLHVQALTDCGLPREALLRALLENYNNGKDAMARLKEFAWLTLLVGEATSRIDAGFLQQQQQQQQAAQHITQQEQQPAMQVKMSHAIHNTRLSVSTTSSNSTGRASFLSTATTMSSVSSQGGAGDAQDKVAAAPLPVPPAPPVKSSNRGASKPPGAYWCTFCDVAFQRKFDWKRHEDEFHERYKRYPCPNCNRIFWGANTFNQHHKNAHGCTTCPHAERVVKYTQRKQAWYVCFSPFFSFSVSASFFVKLCLQAVSGGVSHHTVNSDPLHATHVMQLS
jgi:hypothetical protein